MDNLTEAQRRKNMQNIRSAGTKPEQMVMSELRRRRIYFASHVRSIAGTPDIVFRRKKVAVFVDSDFWHGHPKRYIRPKSNRKYWLPKIRKNIARDKRVTRELRQNGWTVVRMWEYDVNRHCEKCLNKIMKAIHKR